MTHTITTTAIRHGAAPEPVPISIHGVALGPSGGAIISATHTGSAVHVTHARTFAARLTTIAEAIESLLTADATCSVLIDSGLHGLDLWEYLGARRRRGLSLFEVARPELRRAEIAGKLRSALESKTFTIERSLDAVLRKPIADASREDAAERPEIAALSLAVIGRRRIPRIG
jgi:hypothetical protein